MINVAIVDIVRYMRQFLELLQPLPVRFGYVRSIVKDESFVTFHNTNTNPRIGIGNKIVSETTTFVITVQTKTAEQNLIYSSILRYATSGSNITFVMDDFRRDVTVENGWINTIIVTVSNRVGIDWNDLKLPAEDARTMLQEIANRYVLVTSLYKHPFEASIIERFIVPELEKEFYTYPEIMELKKIYDEQLLRIIEY